MSLCNIEYLILRRLVRRFHSACIQMCNSIT
jgi:hypothetical protein